MNMLRRQWRWFVDRVIQRDRADRELDEEIQAHLAIDAEQRIEAGATPAEAWAAARRELGNALRVKELTRDVWGGTSVERLWQDVRYAVRTLRRSPGLAVVVLLALALGIGATTTMFTVLYSVLIRPLPFRDPERLVMVWERTPNSGRDNPVAMGNFLAWQERNRSFEFIAAYQSSLLNLLGADEPLQVTGATVSADFFRVLGVQAAVGRTFLSNEDTPTATPTVVLTHGFWLRRFGGRSDVIGRRISINATHHEVIGVLPASYAYPNQRVQAFIPLRASRNEGRSFSVVARLRPGVSLAAASEEMRGIAAATARERPDMNANWGATVVPLHEQVVGQIRRPLLVLFAAVAVVLLMACANIANLLLMRSAARAREFAVRLALGAGRWRLLHQVLVESLVLAVVGCVGGIALAWVAVRAFVRLAPTTLGLPRLHEVAIDPWVLGFALLVALGTAVLFGIAPALTSGRARVRIGLSSATRSVAASHSDVQGWIVVAEVALALPLLVAAGLMTHSFIRLAQVDPGFRVEGVLTVRMLLLPVRDRSFHAEFIRNVLARVGTVPGVISAGSIGRLPMDGGNSGSWYYRADRPEPPPERRPSGDISIVTPGYFVAMGIPLVKGRDFGRSDRIGAPHVGILNQRAARTLYGDDDPIGKRLTVSWNDAREVEVIGVVADIRHGDISRAPAPCLFLPNDQQPFPFSSLVIRTAGDPLTFAESVKREIRNVDPDQGVAEIQTMERIVAGAMAQPRAQTVLFAAFGGLALALTCIGVYGVLAYAVTQRTREIGVRVALGATPVGAFSLVLRDGLRLTTAGLALGAGATLVLTRFMRGLLFEIEPLDPTAITAALVVVMLVAAAASAIPAIRATRVDPAIVLRDE